MRVRVEMGMGMGMGMGMEMVFFMYKKSMVSFGFVVVSCDNGWWIDIINQSKHHTKQCIEECAVHTEHHTHTHIHIWVCQRPSLHFTSQIH